MKELRVEREHYVTVIVAVIALLVIFGGYASFSGLSVHEDPLVISMSSETFAQGDVFDVNVVVSPVQFLADESIMVYVDGNPVGVIVLKKYLDSNDIEYGSDVKNLGQNNAEIITLKNRVAVNLADYVSLENVPSGTAHTLLVEFSRGDATAQKGFWVK